MELVNTNSVCWAVVLELGLKVCAVVEPDLGAGVTQKSHEDRAGKLEVCRFLFKELGIVLGAEHCLLLHGQIEIHYFSFDPLIAIFLCVYRLYFFYMIYL